MKLIGRSGLTGAMTEVANLRCPPPLPEQWASQTNRHRLWERRGCPANSQPSPQQLGGSEGNSRQAEHLFQGLLQAAFRGEL
jgi:hypothetical protein